MLTRVDGRVTDQGSNPPAVVVVGGDAVVGEALELLLRGADYGVSYVPPSSFDAPRSLRGAHLLLLGPGSDSAERARILTAVMSGPGVGDIPVLELVSSAPASRHGKRHFLASWPCRPEDLKRRIEEILLQETAEARDPSGRSSGGRADPRPKYAE